MSVLKKRLMTFFDRIRLFPLLILVASLALLVRLGEFSTGFQQGTALAQHEVEAEAPPLESNSHPQEPESDKGEQEPLADTEDGDGKKVEWTDAIETEFEFSAAREEIYKDLAKRHKALEQQERVMEVQEALLRAGEKELEQKLRELIAVRNEIEGLLKEQSEEEKARFESLVKIYEGMKAKDAARIFNTLDIDVLITVMSKMSVRKSGPILAAMNPERARTVTILLAR